MWLYLGLVYRYLSKNALPCFYTLQPASKPTGSNEYTVITTAETILWLVGDFLFFFFFSPLMPDSMGDKMLSC